MSENFLEIQQYLSNYEKTENLNRLNPEQIKKLLTYLRNKYPNHKCWELIVKVALATGGRISEILALQSKDIFSEGDSYRIVFYKTKNKKPRETVLPSDLARQLLRGIQYMYHFPHYQSGRDREKFKKDGRLFSHSRSTLNKILLQFSEEAKIRRITPHCLRRTFATTLLSNGFPLNHLQRILGHKYLSSTNAYTRITKPANHLKFLGDWL